MQKSTARPPLGIAFSIVAVVSVFLALLYVHSHEAELLWVGAYSFGATLFHTRRSRVL